MQPVKYLLLFFTLFWSTLLSGQTFWAHKQAGSNVDETTAIASDPNGNVYTTGYFSTSATINGVPLNVAGLTDVFISKIGPSGNSAFVKSAGGSASDRGLDIEVDADGNVYVCGFFGGTINFGNGVTLTANAGSQDAFVVKLNTSGTTLWARAGGSTGNSDRANAIAVDNQGNVYVTGQYSGAATFGPFSVTSLNNTTDAFIIKYNAEGDEQWIKSGSGEGVDRGLCIATDGAGNVYSAGQFSNDITFDATYPNNILNAVYLIKYDGAGEEKWFRWAGGSEQSIANGLTSDGNNVYMTGDFGATISFLGDGISSLNSGYAKSVFIAAWSANGSLLWKTSQGSTSGVSARDIHCRNGELAIAGWYLCTFESLSEQYGESTFNSIGFKDAYVMRYSTGGDFVYARNFGSRSDEICTGVRILPDGHEVLTGYFKDKLIIPSWNPLPAGLVSVPNSPNAGITWCGDPNYGIFGSLNSPGNNQDGFTIKAIKPERAPYDYYQRYGSGCDLSIPEPCITTSLNQPPGNCPDTLYVCPQTNVSAQYYMPWQSDIGYKPMVYWSPLAFGNTFFIENSPLDLYLEVASEDGCYTHATETHVAILAESAPPLLSDGLGINNAVSVTQPIYLCPGESVEIWADLPPGNTGTWTGPDVPPNTSVGQTITASQTGIYAVTSSGPSGCLTTASVTVIVYNPPPENLEPYIFIPALQNDSVLFCGTNTFQVFAFDSITASQIPPQYYDWNWSITSPGIIFVGGSTTTVSIPQNGWYVITLNFQTKDHPCDFDIQTYTVSDSVYVQTYPVPEPALEVTGPAFACAGDTITLHVAYSADTLIRPSNSIADFGDSLYVISPGNFQFSAVTTNEFGCQGTSQQTFVLANAPTPEIFSLPNVPVICPGDSVQLVSNSLGGTIDWIGPDGHVTTSPSIYVHESGTYFTEVTFYEGCALVSNTIEVGEYATPYIAGNDGVMCPGVPLEISIVSPSITNIVWGAPLTGSDTTQVITEPGTYTAQVMSCDIVTEISITIHEDTNNVSIGLPDPTPVCAGDSILVSASPPGYNSYTWMPQGTGTEVWFHESGSVQVTAIDSFGCALTSNTVDLNFEIVPPPPDFAFIPVCEGRTQTVTINSAFTHIFLSAPGGDTLLTGDTFVIPAFVSDTTLYAFSSSEWCAGPVDSLTLTPKPLPEDPQLVTDAPVCTGGQVHLWVANSAPGVDYQWTDPAGVAFFGSDVNYTVPDMNSAGTYLCHAIFNDCPSDTAAIQVDLIQTMQVSLPPDTALCHRGIFSLSPQGVFENYLWQDGSTDSVYLVNESMDVFLLVHDLNGCPSHDFTHIDLLDCEPDVPNVFTPNGDGINDTWFVNLDQPRYFLIRVFNRWGRVVWESHSSAGFWDGTHFKNGEPCSEGVYIYLLNITDFEGYSYRQQGTLTLLRN